KRHCGHVILLVLSRKLFRAAGFGVIANCPSVFSLKAHCGIVLLLWLDGGLIALPPRPRRCRVSRHCSVPSPTAAPSCRLRTAALARGWQPARARACR